MYVWLPERMGWCVRICVIKHHTSCCCIELLMISSSRLIPAAIAITHHPLPIAL